MPDVLKTYPIIGLLAAIVLALAVSFQGAVRAADDEAGLAFLTPFPDGDVYQTTVIGDTFAEGLLTGLVAALGQDKRLNVQRKHFEFTGVMSADFETKVKDFETAIAKEPLGIAVIMFGEDDRVMLKASSGRKVAIASPEWIAEYTRRIDRFMKAIKARNPGVYWLGLPILPRSDASSQVQAMNEVMRERAYVNGFKYVNVFTGFADESGAFSAYGPDLDGKIRVLRSPDGEHFTDVGNRKLAHFVEKELRRDLNEAKSNRTVPLAGTEAEQAKINPENANKSVAPSSPAASGATAATANAAPVVKGSKSDGTSPGVPAADLSGEQKADNSKVTIKSLGAGGREEAATVEIVRPPIPASVVALMARRESQGQAGDLLVDQLAGGLTLMSSISSSGGKFRGKPTPTQAPYFRFLVKGERLSAKPGRADDTSMPESGETSSQAPAPSTSPKG